MRLTTVILITLAGIIAGSTAKSVDLLPNSEEMADQPDDPYSTVPPDDDGDLRGLIAGSHSSPVLLLAPQNKTEADAYNFEVLGAEIQDGPYIVTVKDGQLVFEGLPSDVATTEAPEASTTPKYPSEEKLHNKTNSYILRSQDALQSYLLSILKYRTQLNLNALDSLLPTLEEIAKNLTLLRDSSVQDPEAYNRTNHELEEELVDTENKLLKSRAVSTKIEALPASIKTLMLNTHASLVRILKSQMAVLSGQDLGNETLPEEGDVAGKSTTSTPTPSSMTTTPPGISNQDIKTFINESLQGPLDAGAEDRIMEFMGQLTDENRKTGYFYLFEKLGLNRTYPDTLTIRAMGELQNYPNVSQRLMSSVPDVVSRLFSNKTHCLESKPKNLQLNVVSTTLDWSLRAERISPYAGGCQGSYWKFQRIENSKYFIMLHKVRNIAVGARGNDIIGQYFIPSLATNDAFQWTLALVDSASLRFTNRQNSRVVGLSQDAPGPVYLQAPVPGNSNQYWWLK